MNDRREVYYRELIATLACGLYNGEDWDKQAVACLLHMGEERLDYTFDGPPPETMTHDDILKAVDDIIGKAGI